MSLCAAMRPLRRHLAISVISASVLLSGCSDLFRSDSSAQKKQALPNILFFVLDDVGIDQMKLAGYGGTLAEGIPKTPSLDVIASAGISFRNAWAMPECSPSRASILNGRYSVRTNISTAIVSSDLANSQMSPYEMTTPKLLKTAGYESAMFGKAHFSGSDLAPENNPYGSTAQYQLGWDRFQGWSDGAPKPIDTTAGGIAPTGTYSCGYVPSQSADPQNGADTGACYTVDDACSVISKSASIDAPGRSCLEQGGIFMPNQACVSPRPAVIDFTRQNGYYVGQLFNTDEKGDLVVFNPDHPSGKSRAYRSTVEANLAIDWIRSRPADRPWMATVSFSSAHTPMQPPPVSQLGSGAASFNGTDCDSVRPSRVLMDQMVESMDHQIGRVLVETGLATRGSDGSIQYDPARSNTMVVVVGDNGSYLYTVKSPFDPLHAKAFANQTGVWVPMLVSGPQVVQPGRKVESMVNVTDLYALFGELAKVDVRATVPASRAVDAVSMLPYLSDPATKSIRSSNFSQTASNKRASTTVQSPCSLEQSGVCTTLFPQRALCEMEGGTWWGAGSSQPDVPAQGFTSCCQVNAYQQARQGTIYSIMADQQQAVRNTDYKLLRIVEPTFTPGSDGSSCPLVEHFEFYRIDQAVPVPRIDRPEQNLLKGMLTEVEQRNYQELVATLASINDSVSACPGDGNLDGVVDSADISEFEKWKASTSGKSSWFDFNLDGLTDDQDLQIIRSNLGRKCESLR